MPNAMPQYLKTTDRHNVYSFECPICGICGEIGIPIGSFRLVTHECGMMFIQQPPSGLFSKPRLVEVNKLEN